MYLRAGDECRGISFTPPGEGISFRVHFGGTIAEKRLGADPYGERTSKRHVFAGAMAVVAFGERVTPVQIASAAVIILGVSINSRLSR